MEKTRHRDHHGTGGPGDRCSCGRCGRSRWRRRQRRRRRGVQVFAKGRGRGQVSQRGRRPLVAGGLGELLQQRGRGRVESGHGPDARIAAAHVAADGQRDRGRHGHGHHDHWNGPGSQLMGSEAERKLKRKALRGPSFNMF